MDSIDNTSKRFVCLGGWMVGGFLLPDSCFSMLPGWHIIKGLFVLFCCVVVATTEAIEQCQYDNGSERRGRSLSQHSVHTLT